MTSLEVYHQALPAHYDLIAAGIMRHNEQHTGQAQGQPLTVLARHGRAVVGGLWGELFWGWLKVELLWVGEALRGQGLGREILRRAESEALQQNIQYAYLDTFSFQALEFYQKEGYELFGQLADFPLGHTRYFLQKN